MELPIFQVDAFTGSVFSGNPAAICPLENWLPDRTLQAIAAENNLSETAFFVRENGSFRLRWFTPACEVDLCGHATLASAYVLFSELKEPGEAVRFETRSGTLSVRREGARFLMDFPARPPDKVNAEPELVPALGGRPLEILAARDYLVRYRTEDEVRALTPDMAVLKKLNRFAVIATAPGTDCDFVSRFFAPAKGVPEDPVTGSSHCTLVPYWAAELGRSALHARQISPRGGEVFCKLNGARVELAGHTALYLRGRITI